MRRLHAYAPTRIPGRDDDVLPHPGEQPDQQSGADNAPTVPLPMDFSTHASAPTDLEIRSFSRPTTDHKLRERITDPARSSVRIPRNPESVSETAAGLPSGSLPLRAQEPGDSRIVAGERFVVPGQAFSPSLGSSTACSRTGRLSMVLFSPPRKSATVQRALSTCCC